MPRRTHPPHEGVRAKKRLGQHFLVDAEATQRIVDAVAEDEGRTVIEIGPGTGALTAGLLARFGARLHCIELDEEAVAHLTHRFGAQGLQLHHADCLSVDFCQLGPSPLVMVGNLPYNISSQILIRIYELRHSVCSAVFMLQREVAHRIASRPGGREYGILSVLLQTYYHVDLLFDLPPSAFDPPPKVHSSVVCLRRNDRESLPCDDVTFRQVVRLAFSQRRKMLRNSLASAFSAADKLPCANQRPEQLGVEDFVYLTQTLERESALNAGE